MILLTVFVTGVLASASGFVLGYWRASFMMADLAAQAFVKGESSSSKEVERLKDALTVMSGAHNLQRLEAQYFQNEYEKLKESLTGGLGEAVNYWMNRAVRLEEYYGEDENFVLVVEKRSVPQGAKLVEAYETEDNYIILGEPNDIKDENDPNYHNCDAMGCGSLSHVVAVINKAALVDLAGKEVRL